MFGFDEHREVYSSDDGNYEHHAKFLHELIAGAASFEATKLFEDRQRREGKPVSHQFAKELLAGFAGGEVDRLFETKGLDHLDQLRARREAVEQAQQGYDSHYGNQQEWQPQYQPPFDYQSQDYRY